VLFFVAIKYNGNIMKAFSEAIYKILLSHFMNNVKIILNTIQIGQWGSRFKI